jgi:hypothetical protein
MSETVPEPPRPADANAGEPRARPAAPPQEPPTPMLDVHPVHGAIHGWRDFLLHILIIAIGLGLAISAQQAVEYLHHRHQVADVRRALAQERAENRRTLARQTRAWHWAIAELENNLQVLRYLRQHPGTPQEQLPGVLIWHTSALTFTTAVWDAARENGVAALMPREELEGYSDLYKALDREWQMAIAATMAVLDAERYNLSDADPAHLSPAQIDAEIELLLTALDKHWLVGTEMRNLVDYFPDFPPSVTDGELAQLRHAADEETLKKLGPARALTMQRLRAAGYDGADAAAAPPAHP